ncbi:MAG TPA: epoxyqueuosine reductase, partial [Deltaproteobacteria bacterium]|nr:epoxyqueuosine reductase [Deltaproteobacteria bacterium]
MKTRSRMRERYRRLSFLTDIGGMKNALGEMRGLFFPPQPVLNRDAAGHGPEGLPDEAWFVRAITDKVACHQDNAMEYPFYGERIFTEPLVGFVRGDDPIFERFKEIIGPHHLTPRE